MAKRWLYNSPDPAHLADVDFSADLEPYQEFDAPDSWEPNPASVPVPFKRVTPTVAAPVAKSAPTPAPSQE